MKSNSIRCESRGASSSARCCGDAVEQPIDGGPQQLEVLSGSSRGLTDSRHPDSLALMKPMSLDTHPEVEELMLDAYRRMTPAEKLKRVVALGRAAQAMAAARIRAEYGPDLPERELRLRLASLRLDRRTMVEVFDWDPEEKGY